MKITTTFFRVNFVINVTDAETGEVYLSSDSDFDHTYDCTVDEAFDEVIADLADRWANDRYSHSYVVKKCVGAIRNLYENHDYDVNVYMKAEDNLIQLCADVTIHAEI